jgi:CRP-like cAMP-binding protein
MLTTVERVMILKSIDLLANVGPRHLIKVAAAAREEPMWKGQTIYEERDPAEALYVVVTGKVKLESGERPLSEVGAGQAFGTWSLIDDSERGQRATCLEDGMLLEVMREDFYEVAADETTLLRELLRVLARRLRKLVEERPEEARVEGEGVEATPESEPEKEKAAAADPKGDGSGEAKPATTAPERGASLEAAVLDRTPPAGETPR